MKSPDPPSDRDIADAFLALERTIQDGHLDDFSSRVLARLDEEPQEVGAMDSTELARGSGLQRPDDVAGLVPNRTEVAPPNELPVIVTEAPPAGVPDGGATEVMAGAAV